MQNVTYDSLVCFTCFDNVYGGIVTSIQNNIAQVKIWGHFLTISVPIAKLSTDMTNVVLAEWAELVAWTKPDWLSTSNIRYKALAISQEDDVLLCLDHEGILTIATQDYEEESNPNIKELIDFVALFEGELSA